MSIARAELDGYRLAAVIDRNDQPIALIESPAGEQQWVGVGDRLESFEITAIDDDGIVLQSPHGTYRLDLAGVYRVETQAEVAAEIEPGPHRSQQISFIGLVSRINAVERRGEETNEQAVHRTLNEVFGFVPDARITEVNRVKVASASEAQAHLQRHLAGNEPVQLTVAGDQVESLYVVPE